MFGRNHADSPAKNQIGHDGRRPLTGAEDGRWPDEKTVQTVEKQIIDPNPKKTETGRRTRAPQRGIAKPVPGWNNELTE